MGHSPCGHGHKRVHSQQRTPQQQLMLHVPHRRLLRTSPPAGDRMSLSSVGLTAAANLIESVRMWPLYIVQCECASVQCANSRTDLASRTMLMFGAHCS
jgi:hypothetical protein